MIDPLIACGVCDSCHRGRSNYCTNSTTIGRTGPGGFSDYILMPESSVYVFSPKLDYVTACLAEPLACVIHGVERARVGLGQTVLVKGAGSIGQMHVLVSKLAGASVVAVTDFNQKKLEQVKALGSDYVFNASADDFDAQVHKVAPNGFDVVIDSTGVPDSVQSAIPYVKNAGTLLIFGVCPRAARTEFSPFEIYFREISIVGSFAFPKDTLIKSLNFIAAFPFQRGALCRYFAYPEQMVHLLPDNVTTLEGAMIEPLSTGLYAAKRGGVSLGDTVVILGAGGIGLMILQACLARGASAIVVDLFSWACPKI